MSTLCQTWDYKLEIQGPSTHSSIAQSRNGTQGWQHYISERWVHLEDRKLLTTHVLLKWVILVAV